MLFIMQPEYEVKLHLSKKGSNLYCKLLKICKTFCPYLDIIRLSSPTMHGTEATYMMEAYETNWMSTVGENINEVEAQVAEYVGVKHAVALSAGTAALHLATKLAAERLYGQARPNEGSLRNHPVLASDCTFDASINPIAYEDGEGGMK